MKLEGVMRVLMTSALLSIATLSAYPALADISSPAIVTDGDSIKVDGERIRMHGIDAPEAKGRCYHHQRHTSAALRACYEVITP
jgi:endonuclease YncB( thermonuclease family)